MSKTILNTALLSLILQSVFSMPVKAGEKKHKRQPPKEAIEACINKEEGDEVTFKGRKGEELSATCVIMNNQLVALPKGHKRKDT